jgi:hypothetical protein
MTINLRKYDVHLEGAVFEAIPEEKKGSCAGCCLRTNEASCARPANKPGCATCGLIYAPANDAARVMAVSLKLTGKLK